MKIGAGEWELSGVSSSKDSNPVLQGLTLRFHLTLTTYFEAPSPNTATQPCWRLGFKIRTLRGHKHLVHNRRSLSFPSIAPTIPLPLYLASLPLLDL